MTGETTNETAHHAHSGHISNSLQEMTGTLRDICSALLRHVSLLADNGRTKDALDAGRRLLQHLRELTLDGPLATKKKIGRTAGDKKKKCPSSRII